MGPPLGESDEKQNVEAVRNMISLHLKDANPLKIGGVGWEAKRRRSQEHDLTAHSKLHFNVSVMKISNICSYIDFEDIDIYSGIGSYVRIVENPNSLRHPFVILKIIPTTQIIGGKSAQAINARSSKPERTISWRRRQTSSDDSPSPPRPATEPVSKYEFKIFLF